MFVSFRERLNASGRVNPSCSSWEETPVFVPWTVPPFLHIQARWEQRTAPDGPECGYAAERTTEDCVRRNSSTDGYLLGFVISFLFYQTR